jgi:hypothetical protein
MSVAWLATPRGVLLDCIFSRSCQTKVRGSTDKFEKTSDRVSQESCYLIRPQTRLLRIQYDNQNRFPKHIQEWSPKFHRPTLYVWT